MGDRGQKQKETIAHITALSECHNLSYGRYVLLKLRANNSHRTINRAALLDSGNEWRTVISLSFAKTLNIQLNNKTDRDAIGTAKEGTQMKVIGEASHPIEFSFAECPQAGVFTIQPAVLKGLAMDINISGPFLKHYGIEQHHAKGYIKVRNQMIPLASSPSNAKRRMYVAKTTVVKPNGITMLPAVATISQITSGQWELQGENNQYLRVMGLLPPAACSVEVKNGQTMVPICNTSSQPVIAKEGSCLGTIQPMEQSNNSATDDMWRPPKQPLEGKPMTLPVATPQWVEKEFLPNLTHPQSSITTKEERRAALDLLIEYADVFSHDGSFGRTDLVRHAIHTGTAIPVKCRNCPVNPALIDNLRQQMEEWLKHDVIEPSTSPWSSALVAVKKKNGKTRWCADYRALNDVTIKDAYPMPSIEDNLARLAYSTHFSSVDGSGAFHVVALEEDSKPKTAFATPWGLWQFKRMPFGLTNAPATYSRLMQLVLRDIPGNEALSYLDDTLVHGATFRQHLTHFRHVLQAHREAGLRLQPSKCHLFRRQVEYLGHLVTGEGIKPVPTYLEIVQKWPVPQTVTEARAFLGKVGYYRRFIKGYGALAKPLTDAIKDEHLLDKDKKLIKITPEVKQSHATLRDALCKAPILAYPRFDAESPFIVDTDWSHDGRSIGAVLSQRQEGKERVICYGAKKLSPSQANYSATKGELYAIIYFLRHWRYYLQWKEFILRTDHQALTWLRTMDAPDGMTARWLDTLANFSFKVQYRPGPKHGNADGLSRAPHLPEQKEVDQDDDEERLSHLRLATISTLSDEDEEDGNIVRDTLSMSPFAQSRYLPRTSAEWAQEQKHDPTLRYIIACITQKYIPTKEMIRRFSPPLRYLYDLLPLLYLDENNTLSIITPTPGTTKLPVGGIPIVPRHLERPLVKLAHEIVGHRGIHATHYVLCTKAFLPSGRALVEEVIQQCIPCQAKLDAAKQQRHTYRTAPISFPFQRLSIDFVGPLPKTERGNTMLLTIKDQFSKWVEAFPIQRATSELVADILMNQIFSRFGYPDEIHSDQGSQFTSNLMKELGQLLDIKISYTPTYHPQSNPVERAHRDLKMGLRAALLSVNGSQWDQHIGPILFAFRIAPARGIGMSPFFCLFGRHPNIPLGALAPPPKSGIPLAKYTSELRDRLEKVHAWARTNLVKEVTRQQRAYKGVEWRLLVGDKVWMFNPSLTSTLGKKLSICWTGPWIVQEIISPVLFRIQALNSDITHIAPIDRLKPYCERTVKTIPTHLYSPSSEHHPLHGESLDGSVGQGSGNTPTTRISTAEESGDEEDFIHPAGNPRPLPAAEAGPDRPPVQEQGENTNRANQEEGQQGRRETETSASDQQPPRSGQRTENMDPSLRLRTSPGTDVDRKDVKDFKALRAEMERALQQAQGRSYHVGMGRSRSYDPGSDYDESLEWDYGDLGDLHGRQTYGRANSDQPSPVTTPDWYRINQDRSGVSDWLLGETASFPFSDVSLDSTTALPSDTYILPHRHSPTTQGTAFTTSTPRPIILQPREQQSAEAGHRSPDANRKRDQWNTQPTGSVNQEKSQAAPRHLGPSRKDVRSPDHRRGHGLYSPARGQLRKDFYQGLMDDEVSDPTAPLSRYHYRRIARDPPPPRAPLARRSKKIAEKKMADWVRWMTREDVNPKTLEPWPEEGQEEDNA